MSASWSRPRLHRGGHCQGTAAEEAEGAGGHGRRGATYSYHGHDHDHYREGRWHDHTHHYDQHHHHPRHHGLGREERQIDIGHRHLADSSRRRNSSSSSIATVGLSRIDMEVLTAAQGFEPSVPGVKPKCSHKPGARQPEPNRYTGAVPERSKPTGRPKPSLRCEGCSRCESRAAREGGLHVVVQRLTRLSQELATLCCSFREAVNMTGAPWCTELRHIYEPALVGGVGLGLEL